MTGNHFEQLDELFRGALRVPEDERTAWLERACEGDERLKAQVAALLAEDQRAAGALDAPVLGGDDSPVLRAADVAQGVGQDAERAGGRIGPYRLLERLGEGGFGVVWMAEQSQPVVRRVALKVIKLGMDTRQVIARFEAERQALAMMDHPHIATALDAGATENGRPYFVMELSAGTAITDYCRDHGLTVPERLNLFGQVCRAIEHAHQKGVVHRDVKPGNVLVETRDGRPFARVIDFGIAKATEARLTERTYFTEHRQMIGTPEYMSPEQAEGLPDVDTRTDVYGLGVLLYELLTGSTPHDAAELRAAGWAGIARMIREVTPPAPSTRRTRAGGPKSGGLAADGHPAPRRGELDWIVMKAIAIERSRRYQSAGALAEDVGAFLDGRPVAAAPPSRTYRVRTFVRRNRGLVAATSILAATLLVGIAGTTWGLLRARDAAAEASQRVKELDLVASFQSTRLVDVDPQVFGARILEDVVGRLPDESRDMVAAALADVAFTDVALGSLEADILQPAVSAAREEFDDQPLVRARILQSIAYTAVDLGLLDLAESPQVEALDVRREILGEEDPATLESLRAMVVLGLEQEQIVEVEPLAQRSVELHRRVMGVAEETAEAIGALGAVLHGLRRMEDALALLVEAHELSTALNGPDDPATMTSLSNIGTLQRALGKTDEAESTFRTLLEQRRRILGPDDSATLATTVNLARILRLRGDNAGAEPLYLATVEGHRRIHGDDHPRTLHSMGNLGVFYHSTGRPDQAEPVLREVVEKLAQQLGPDARTTLSFSVQLGQTLVRLGRLDEAREVLTATRQRATDAHGAGSRSAIRAELNLGFADFKGGDRAGAIARLTALRARSAELMGEDSLYTQEVDGLIATIQAEAADAADAADPADP
ncbi:MAG: tetratricopeptide repeat protein [Phycisphaerales bacterium]